jgi:hypothetical protein
MHEMSLYCSDLHCCCFTCNFATQIRGNWNQDTKFMALIDSIIGATGQWVASTDELEGTLTDQPAPSSAMA